MESLGHIGKYELLKQLAVGGMAEIYLARQSGPEGFSKLVVIKRILPSLAAQERFVEMFLDEARLAARFNHPNICQIFDLGRESDSFYIAMEYIHGEDIKSVVRRCAKKRQRIPIEHVVKMFSGVLDGLNFAHSQENLDGHPHGVVHRDVSPHNIILSFQGGVKLVDFGIAKARTEISTTVPGRVKGKHAYMSPEQVRGLDLDGRSDVFAVGIVMYELLTWSRLFKRKKHLDTLRAVCESPIRPPSELNSQVDKALERIVLKSLDRDLNGRYQTAQEMQIDLEDYLLGAGLRSNPVLLGQFMSELYADKLEAREKALTEAKAADLEGAILKAGDQGPDLVAFLDMFFGESGSSGSNQSVGEGLDESSAPEFTPSGEYTPAKAGEALREGRRGEIPARARGEYLTRNAPPVRAPNGMEVKHVGPGIPGEDIVDPGAQGPDVIDPAASPGDGDIFDPATYDDPMDGYVDPEKYADEIGPMQSTGGWIKSIIVLLVIIGLVAGGVLLFMHKDELMTPDAPETGIVKIKSIPGGADVYLDGMQQTARTPMEIDGIKPGEEYELEVSLPGLPTWKDKFTLTDTTQPLLLEAVLSKSAADKVRMQGKPIVAGIEGEGNGSISVESTPPGALIYLDGVATGRKTPATLNKVAAGLDHVVLVATKAKAPAYQRLNLKAGDKAKVQLTLGPSDGQHPDRIKVRFETEPEGAKVSINGYPMSKKTPLATKLLYLSDSEVEFEHKDAKRKVTKKIRPIPNVDLTIFVKLK